MPPTDQPRLATRGVVAAGLALTALAWWVRAAPLGPGSLWLDDLWVVAPSQAGSLGDALDMLVTTPLFTVVVNVVYGTAGPSSIAAQLVPFLAGVLGPVAALLVARSLRWSWPAAVVTAVVVAVAPEHVVHSTRVKQYTLEVLIGLAAVALSWRSVRTGSRPWPLAGLAAVATVVSASAGVYAGSVLAATTLVQLVDHRSGPRDRRPAVDPGGQNMVVPALAFGGFALLWWAGYLRTHVPDGLRDYWRADFLDTGDYLGDLGASLDRMADGFLPLAPAWPWLALAAAVVAVVRPRFALVLATPVVAAILLATLELAPLGTGRTDIHLLPSAALVAGAAVDVLARRVPTAALPAGVAVSVLLVGGFAVRDLRPTAYPAFDVRALIEEAERTGDGRIVVYPATRWAWAVYGAGGFEPVDADNETGFDVRITAPDVTVLGPHRDDPARYAAELDRATAGADRVTFVASHWREDIAAIESWFATAGWTEDRRLERPGARLVEWRRPRS